MSFSVRVDVVITSPYTKKQFYRYHLLDRLYYIGTVDGHNLQDLVAILQEVKTTRSVGPVLIHIVTEKGRGYSYAEAAQDKYHGVSTFDVASG